MEVGKKNLTKENYYAETALLFLDNNKTSSIKYTLAFRELLLLLFCYEANTFFFSSVSIKIVLFIFGNSTMRNSKPILNLESLVRSLDMAPPTK